MFTNLRQQNTIEYYFFYQAVMLSILFLDLEFQKILSKIDFPLNIHVLSKSTFLKFKILYDYRTWQSLLHTGSDLIKNQTMWLIWASGENTVTIPDVSKRIMVPKSSWWTIYASFAISFIQSSPILRSTQNYPNTC